MDNLGYSNSPSEASDHDVSTINGNNNTIKASQTFEDSSPTDPNLREDEDSCANGGKCGIFNCKPKWLQKFPTKTWFIAVFLIATTVKGMAGSYFPSTISSVEKRLKISTETIGYVSSGNEISQILFSLVLSYFGGKGHRPRWIAFGIFASSLAYFLYATPHLIYGPGNTALSYTAEYYAQYHENDTDWSRINQNYLSLKNLSADLDAEAICKQRNLTGLENADCGIGDNSIAPMAIIFSSQFIAGIGSVLVYTLAGPFIDDHMKPLQAPLMIAVTGAVRQVGPLVGYVLAYFCLKTYVNPVLTPLITNKDDRWLGAWWLGWIVLSLLMLIASSFMALFPRVLRISKKSITPETNDEILSMESMQRNDAEVDKPKEPRRSEPIFNKSTKDLEMVPSLVDLMKNKANLWNNLSILFFGFAFSGFGSYFPKYLETVVKQNAANAALVTGLSSIVFQVSGLLLGGYLIVKFSLRARTLAGINVIVDVLVVLVLMSFSQLVCKQGEIVDTTLSPSSYNFNNFNESFQIAPSCIAGCDCTSNQNSPVCYSEKNIIFQSPCHAGCKNYDAISEEYSNCSCLPSPDISLKNGKCVNSDDCYFKFMIFIALIASVRFFTSFGLIGNVLIPYRCVDRSQKSLATGLTFVMYSIVSIPSPILYGKIIDSACIRWGTKCGQRGNCLLYDDVTFAYVMSSTAAGLSFFGLLCNCMVWYYVKDLKLYGEEESEIEEKKNQQNNK